MKYVTQLIFTIAMVVGLSVAAFAQSKDPKKPPKKRKPPVIKPKPKGKKGKRKGKKGKKKSSIPLKARIENLEM